MYIKIEPGHASNFIFCQRHIKKNLISNLMKNNCNGTIKTKSVDR